jgi:hypothetical protein
MYAYEQGVSQVLPDVGAKATKMPDWDTFLGKEGIVEAKPEKPANVQHRGPVSKEGLQWLPAEFKVSQDGQNCEINSYINSLHPIKHKDLYDCIGRLFCHALPLFESVLSEAGELTDNNEAGELTDNIEQWPGSGRNASITLRERELRVPVDMRWWEEEEDPRNSSERKFLPPEIPDFTSTQYTKEAADVNLRNRPLQVITKIASLELEAGEDFKGGVWHVEGCLGDRIVATACYYLECENVQGGKLAFRASVDDPIAEQYDDDGVELMYGLVFEEALVQSLGSCVTCRKGRVLAWPNTHQHKVEPVSLVDPTRPGKRTILCFFLVDPTLRVRSTATVPPQQLAWVEEAVHPELATKNLDDALQEMVFSFLASSSLLTYKAACERRERLMDERRQVNEVAGRAFERPFSLCEH